MCSKMGNGLQIIILTLLVKYVSSIKSEFTVPRNTVEILVGDDTCISNCSRFSAEGNEPLLCSVEDCKVLETAGSNVRALEVNRKNIYFERYFDESDNQRLALHFKWHPVDDDSIQRSRGYLLNISDGTSTYSTCYTISTPMSLSFNAKSLFYNDCFGKVKGTMIRLGSKITVNITTLPLFDTNHDDGKAMFVVEVPDCHRAELHGFSECSKAGNPTRQPCAKDCNTYSEINGVRHPVTCSVSKTSIHSIASKEKCDDVAKVTTGTPSAPKRIAKEQEWYKYYDADDNIKIALNFSWRPKSDSSIGDLHGYYLEINPRETMDLSYYNKCFSVHTNLTSLKHSQTEFFHDCYGRGVRDVLPGSKYLIHLNSWPGDGTETEKFIINVPDCSDARMKDVLHCIKEAKKRITGSVDEIFCSNRSMKYTYHVSSEYGNFADIVFCEYGHERKVCQKMLQRLQNLAPKNTLYNISLPTYANLSLNYSIFVHGSSTGYERALTFPNFSQCVVDKAGVDGTTIIIILILIFGVLCVIGLVILFCFMCRKECWRKFFLKYGRRGQNVTISTGHDGARNESLAHIENGPLQPVQEAEVTPRICVYVIFMNDHELHVEVVHHFCSYLQADLGMDVILHIWELRDVAANALLFMESRLERADKVIVICSEGTKNCLDKEEYDGDMFTPVVKNICQQLFVGHNPEKFLVGFFDYSHITHVPEFLRQQSTEHLSLFALMKQIEPFYFRLIGVDQYQEGGVYRVEKVAFDRYCDPTLTKHGKALKEAIDKMKDYVEKNPTWYIDHGSDRPQSASMPQPVPKPFVGSLLQDRSILDPAPAGASISRIDAVPPPGLNNGLLAVSTNISQPRQAHRRKSGTQSRHLALASMTSTSTDSSYVVTEVEDLSLSPSGADSPTQDVFHSYPAGSFDEFDFSTSEDYNTDKRLLSNETEIKRIGLTPSTNPFLLIEEEEDVEEHEARSSPESGVFTLAPVEDTEDLEEHIKSINQSEF